MASTVASTSSLLADDESWHKDPEGLDAIAEFNASYDASQSIGTIDPQLTFSNPQTPDPTHSSALVNPFISEGMHETLSPECTVVYAEYPPDIFNQVMGSPYFHQTNEVSPPELYFPSPLRNMHNLHRRSVSEPPGQHQHQQPQHLRQLGGGRGVPAGGVIFHRENHTLGTPISKSRPMPPRSQTKASNRQTRQHPYARPKSSQHQQNSQRGQIMAPTSMPYPSHQQQYHQHQQMFAPMQPSMMVSPMQPDPSQYAPSRVCTPAPETPSPSLRRQVKIDPNLTGGSLLGIEATKSTVVMGVSIEELREMIFETVRRAVAEKTEKAVVVSEETRAVVSREGDCGLN